MSFPFKLSSGIIALSGSVPDRFLVASVFVSLELLGIAVARSPTGSLCHP